jgi:hypothetical protein
VARLESAVSASMALLERTAIARGGAVDQDGEFDAVVGVEGMAETFGQAEGGGLRRVEELAEFAFEIRVLRAVAIEHDLDGALRGSGLVKRHEFVHGEDART